MNYCCKELEEFETLYNRRIYQLIDDGDTDVEFNSQDGIFLMNSVRKNYSLKINNCPMCGTPFTETQPVSSISSDIDSEDVSNRVKNLPETTEEDMVEYFNSHIGYVMRVLFIRNIKIDRIIIKGDLHLGYKLTDDNGGEYRVLVRLGRDGDGLFIHENGWNVFAEYQPIAENLSSMEKAINYLETFINLSK